MSRDWKNAAFDLISSTTFDGLIREKNGLIQQANRAMHELAGFEAGTLNGIAIDRVIPGIVLNHEEEGQTIGCDLVWPDKSKRPVEVIHRQTQSNGEHIISVRDLSRQKASESLIQVLANTDPLTGVLNRGAFEQNAQKAVESTVRRCGSTAVLHVSINRFSTLAEDLGNAIADQVLIQVSQRLKGCVRQTDSLARVSRDEFGILQSTSMLSIDTAALAERILKEMEPPFPVGSKAIIVNVSVGTALYPSDGSTARELVRNAGLATRQARLDGRGRWRHFEPSMDADARKRQMIQRDLFSALKNDEFVIHYQPFFDAATLEIAGYEALLRWVHPERGLMLPSDFIPIAEESGLIVPIGKWVLEAACKEAASWRRPMSIAINLSPAQLEQQGMVKTISGILDRSGLPAERLELEVTETTLMGDREQALRALMELKELGVQLAMDDFGTGYSSLNYLRMFPFDKIKIDRSFIKDFERDAEAKSIVQCIVGIGTALHLKITAEGIETREQLTTVRDHGCSYLQGYLLGQPTPAALHLQVTNSPHTITARPDHAPLRGVCDDIWT